MSDLVVDAPAPAEAPVPTKALMLRTCSKELTSYNGFQWPESGLVECPDWNPEPICGGGLHGLLWGAGAYSLLNRAADAKWMIVEVELAMVVHIDSDKVKVPRGTVVYCGTSVGALAVLRAARWGMEQMASSLTASSTTGDAAHSSTTGDAAHSSTTGNAAHSSTTGTNAVAACLGFSGRVRATHGPLVASWWDGKRTRVAVAYPGEEGIEADVWYRVDKKGRFVKATDV